MRLNSPPHACSAMQLTRVCRPKWVATEGTDFEKRKWAPRDKFKSHEAFFPQTLPATPPQIETCTQPYSAPPSRSLPPPPPGPLSPDVPHLGRQRQAGLPHEAGRALRQPRAPIDAQGRVLLPPASPRRAQEEVRARMHRRRRPGRAEPGCHQEGRTGHPRPHGRTGAPPPGPQARQQHPQAVQPRQGAGGIAVQAVWLGCRRKVLLCFVWSWRAKPLMMSGVLVVEAFCRHLSFFFSV